MPAGEEQAPAGGQQQLAPASSGRQPGQPGRGLTGCRQAGWRRQAPYRAEQSTSVGSPAAVQTPDMAAHPGQAHTPAAARLTCGECHAGPRHLDFAGVHAGAQERSQVQQLAALVGEAGVGGARHRAPLLERAPAGAGGAPSWHSLYQASATRRRCPAAAPPRHCMRQQPEAGMCCQSTACAPLEGGAGGDVVAGGAAGARRGLQVGLRLSEDAHIGYRGLKVDVLGHGALLQGAGRARGGARGRRRRRRRSSAARSLESKAACVQRRRAACSNCTGMLGAVRAAQRCAPATPHPLLRFLSCCCRLRQRGGHAMGTSHQRRWPGGSATRPMSRATSQPKQQAEG